METKAKITRIGTITEDGTVKGWTFDGTRLKPRPSAIRIRKDRHVIELIGGYTIKELREIIKLNHKLEQLTQGR